MTGGEGRNGKPIRKETTIRLNTESYALGKWMGKIRSISQAREVELLVRSMSVNWLTPVLPDLSCELNIIENHPHNV